MSHYHFRQHPNHHCHYPYLHHHDHLNQEQEKGKHSLGDDLLVRHHHLHHHSLCWAEQVSLLQGDSNVYNVDCDNYFHHNHFLITMVWKKHTAVSFIFFSSPLILYLYLTLHLYSYVDLYTIYRAIQNQRDYALVGSSDNLILMQRFTLTWSCGWPLFCPSVPPLSLTFSYSGQTHEDADFTYTSIKLCMKTDTCNSFSPISNLDHVFQKTLWLCQDLLWTVIFIFWYVYIWYIWYIYLLICLSLITLSWDIFIFDILIFDIFIFRYLYLLIYV